MPDVPLEEPFCYLTTTGRVTGRALGYRGDLTGWRRSATPVAIDLEAPA